MKLSQTLLVLLALVCVGSVGAQDPSGDSPDKTPPEKQDKSDVLRERTIYVPYTKLRAIFEKEGRGVFVPYDKFQELWQAARKATEKVDDDAPPFGAILTEIDNEATVEGDVLVVRAKAAIEVIREGWHEIPLRLQDAALRSAKLGDAPARIISTDHGHALLVEKKGKEPQRLELKLEYAKAYTKSPGSNRVSLAAPQAPVNRWKVRVPDANVKINVQPMLAATKPAGDDPEAKFDPAKETLVLAFVGAAGEVKIDWTAKAEGAAGLEALVNVKTQQTVAIEEGVVRVRATLNFEISRAELKQITLESPAGYEIKGVYDANVKGIEVKKGAGGLQTTTVALHQPIQGAQALVVEMESILDDKKEAADKPRDVSIPYVKVVPGESKASVRQQGIVLIQAAPSLRAEVGERTGLMQFDLGEIPDNLKNQPWLFSYRYSSAPFGLTLQIEKVKPEIDVTQLAEIVFEPDQTVVQWLGVYNIERAGVFQLELTIPQGMEVRRVEGRPINDAQPVTVDSFHVVGDNKDKLVVNLARRAQGKAALFVELHKPGNDANLAAPTGMKSELELVVPQATGEFLLRARGGLVIFAPESLSLEPGELTQLQTSSPNDARQNLPSQVEGHFNGVRPTAAFAFSKEPAKLKLSAERRQPQVTVREFLGVKIEPGRVDFNATFFVDVAYSGVKSIRIDVPKAAAGSKLRNLSQQYNFRPLTPAPDDVAEGFVAYEMTGGKELYGSHALQLTWTQDIGSLEVGKDVKFEAPRFVAKNVSRFWGQIAVAKAEDLEVTVSGAPKGLRPIDPQRDLIAGASLPGAVRAFEFHDDWSLFLNAVRYELHEVKRTSIDRAVAQFVETLGGELSVQAIYRVRTARQRLAIELPSGIDPKDGFDSQPLRINGLPVSLERDQKRFYVPLAGRTPDQPFVLELRYTAPRGARQFELPTFPEDPAVQQVFAAVYLPQNRKLLGMRGPWFREGQTGLLLPPKSAPFANDQQLLNWVRAEVPGADQAGTGFPVDGAFHLFSTMRPPQGEAGALALVTANETVVYILTFLLFAAVGVGFAWRSLGEKVIGLAAVIVGIVLISVFLPTFAAAIWTEALVWAALVTAVIWGAQLIVWCSKHCPPLRRAAIAGTAAAAATTSPPTAPDAPDDIHIVKTDHGQPAVPPNDANPNQPQG